MVFSEYCYIAIFPNDAIYCIRDISRYKTLILGPDVFLSLKLLLSSALADVGGVALHIAIGPTASHSGQPNAIVHL